MKAAMAEERGGKLGAVFENWTVPFMLEEMDKNGVTKAVLSLSTAPMQWFRSEQEGHSVIPISFWYCSLIGGLISFAYALHLQAWPLLISTGMPLPIYARNVWMIYRDRWRTAPVT